MTVFSPPGVFFESAQYPTLLGGVLASMDPVECLSVYNHPDVWDGLGSNAILKMRESLFRFLVPINARTMEPASLVKDLQTLALSVSPVAIGVECESPPPRRLFRVGGQLPAGPKVNTRSLELLTQPEVSRVALKISESGCPSAEAIWKLLDYDYSLDQVARLMSVGLLGKVENRRIISTKSAYKATIDSFTNRVILETSERPTIDEYRIYSSSLLGDRFVVLVQPGEARVDYLRLNKTVKGIENGHNYESAEIPSSDPKTSVYADHARYACYRHIVDTDMTSHMVVFHYSVLEKNQSLGPWLARAGVKSAFESEPVTLDTLTSSIAILDSVLEPSLSLWHAKTSVLDRLNKMTGHTQTLLVR